MESEIFAYAIGVTIGLIGGVKLAFALFDAEHVKPKRAKKGGDHRGT